jgi:hypothetical protein
VYYQLVKMDGRECSSSCPIVFCISMCMKWWLHEGMMFKPAICVGKVIVWI